jgi:TRAP-type C4-dicarboxylate transport system substrate-binding protein
MMVRIAMGLILALAVSVIVGVQPAAAQKQTLHMAYWSGPSHQMVQTLAAWIKTIEEASGGNLTVEVDKAALGKMEGQYDLIRNGVRDLVWAVPGYTVGRFDMLAAAELPLMCPSPAICSPVLWKWYEKHGLAAKEFTDTKLLVTFTGGPYGIHTTKPAKTLDELKTLKIRAAGPSLPTAKALGLNAVPLPATETYEAVQRGTVDGSLFPWEAMTSFRLNELLKGHLGVPGGLGAPSFVIVANQKAFDGLTPANKAALIKASSEAGSALIGKAWQNADDHGRNDAKEKGQAVDTVAPAEFEKWKPLLQTVTDDWIKKANDKGYDGRKLLDDLQAMIKAASS